MVGWVGSNWGRKDKREERKERIMGLICYVNGMLVINYNFNTILRL